jgi:hypothetical protein
MLRVVIVESSTIAPTGTYTWGETEDYAVNIVKSSVLNPANSYSWSANPSVGAGLTVTSGNSVTATPTIAGTYT